MLVIPVVIVSIFSFAIFKPVFCFLVSLTISKLHTTAAFYYCIVYLPFPPSQHISVTYKAVSFSPPAPIFLHPSVCFSGHYTLEFCAVVLKHEVSGSFCSPSDANQSVLQVLVPLFSSASLHFPDLSWLVLNFI